MKDAPSPQFLSRLDTYRLEGLVGDTFQAHGDTENERLSSLEAKAYTTWVKKNADRCGNHHPETVGSAFLMRHDPSWTWPEFSIGAMPTAASTAPPAGFSRPDPVLPPGDAYEGPEEPATLFTEPAEVPPPTEG